MTFSEIRAAIESRMATITGLPVAWDNLAISSGVATAQQDKAPWCRLTIQDGSSEFATHDTLTRRGGVVFVQVFTDERTGTATARQKADDVAALLQGYTTAGLRLRAASVARVGPEDGWYQINVQVPFEVYA